VTVYDPIAERTRSATVMHGAPERPASCGYRPETVWVVFPGARGVAYLYTANNVRHLGAELTRR